MSLVELARRRSRNQSEFGAHIDRILDPYRIERPTVAVRMPLHGLALEVLKETGPLAVSSANLSGVPAARTVEEAEKMLGEAVTVYLDGGPSGEGEASSIVDLTGPIPRLLRAGAITREAIESVLGSPIDSMNPTRTAPSAPGQLASHYAPNAELRLGAATTSADEAALDFAGSLRRGASGARLDLSPSGDLVEAASHLFSYLRALDAAGAARIAVAPIPEHGLGAAINDRLRRAAAPRDVPT